MKMAPLVDLRHPRSIPAETLGKALKIAGTVAYILSISENLEVRRPTLRDRLEAHNDCAPLRGYS
jgi:hypothetical protein